jgi:predicted nucleic acid-binding protein
VGTIILDASVLIAFLQAADAQHERAVGLLTPHLSAGNRLLMPASVYTEILVGPIRSGLDRLVDGFIEDSRVEIVEIDRVLGRRAAQIRAKNSALRLPDALVLATADEYEGTLLTLDLRLRRAADGHR